MQSSERQWANFERLLWVISSLSASYQANGRFRPEAAVQIAEKSPNNILWKHLLNCSDITTAAD
jgi:hypothetical protein